MNEALALRWVPESVLRAAEATVRAELLAWCQAWGLPEPKGLSAAIVQADDLGLSTTVGDLLDDGAAPATWRQLLAQALFQTSAQGSPIVDGVVTRATEALRAGIRQRCGASARSVSAPLGHRGIALQVQLLGCEWGLQLSWDALERQGWIQRPALAAPPTWSLPRAAAHLPLELVAEVGRVEVKVSDLLQLTEGDVLLLPKTLNQALEVCVAGTELGLQAQLGACGAAHAPQRGLRWLAAH